MTRSPGSTLFGTVYIITVGIPKSYIISRTKVCRLMHVIKFSEELYNVMIIRLLDFVGLIRKWVIIFVVLELFLLDINIRFILIFKYFKNGNSHIILCHRTLY